ncbi:hypothetical protein ACQKOF_16550 [Lysinibacillus sp. NPDC093190]|uniref:hypothetical protein n=1 Tax=Lysinibacillus sp. NPDC093190 TaxID=3390575 RepID=UPI003D031F7A
MKNLITHSLKKNIETKLEFTLDNNIEEIFEKCLLIKGVTVIQFVAASDSPKMKSITF